MTRMTDKQVIRGAIDDALEWNISLLDAIGPDDDHIPHVKNTIRRLREVREKYFGKRPDPFKNARLVPLSELRGLADAADNPEAKR